MYSGTVQTLHFGMGGLHTDDPETQVPVTDLIRAINVTYEGNKLSKAPGSHKFNRNALSSGIVGAFDWWPDEVTQRIIAVTDDGLVWKMPNFLTQTTVAPFIDTTQTNLMVNNQVSLVAGGAESATSPRKLFIFTGSNTVQVIAGDSNTRTNITKPALDWSSTNQPASGIIHHNRLWAWGNINNPHQLYASNPNDQEDFQTTADILTFSVYPGEHEKILACYVFKGRMFIFKYPLGIYYLNDSDPDTNNWSIVKYVDNFGAASAHSGVMAINDMLVANSFGTITSAKAVLSFGGFDLADVLTNTRNAQFVRENISSQGNLDRHGIYYEFKKQVLFSYRSSAGIKNDRILLMDYSQNPDVPKIAWWDKDQANCLFLRKDIKGIPKPAYGANDGFVYLMDQVDRDVGGNSYEGEFMTPFYDCANGLPPMIAESNKLFDFLEFTFESYGKWDLSVDVFIDGKFSETIEFSSSMLKGTDETLTNIDRTYGGAPFQIRKQLHGRGKRIAFRGYNSGLLENFALLRAQIYFRAGSQGEKDAS